MASAGETEHDCPRCLESWKNMEKLKCGHELCKECKTRLVETMRPVCPLCKDVFGKIEGDQPHGTMTWESDSDWPLHGFPHCGRIVITYNIPDGTQTEDHPNPGKNYEGIQKTDHLPDNTEGREVFRLLKKAFDQKLLFTVWEDQVTWNDIHYKIYMTGGPSLASSWLFKPDDNYLSRVRAELKAKGIE